MNLIQRNRAKTKGEGTAPVYAISDFFGTDLYAYDCRQGAAVQERITTGKYALSRRRASLPMHSGSAWSDPLDPDSWDSSGRSDTWSALTISRRGLFCTGGSVGKNSCCNLPILVGRKQSVKVLRAGSALSTEPFESSFSPWDGHCQWSTLTSIKIPSCHSVGLFTFSLLGTPPPGGVYWNHRVSTKFPAKSARQRT